MTELTAAYRGIFASAKDHAGKSYENDRSKLLGEEGFILIYRERTGEAMRFIPDRSGDEVLVVPSGLRRLPLKSDRLVFESVNSVYEFTSVRRIK